MKTLVSKELATMVNIEYPFANAIWGFGWKNCIKVFEVFGVFDKEVSRALINANWANQSPQVFLAERFGELKKPDKIRMLRTLQKCSDYMRKNNLITIKRKIIKRFYEQANQK